MLAKEKRLQHHENVYLSPTRGPAQNLWRGLQGYDTFWVRSTRKTEEMNRITRKGGMEEEHSVSKYLFESKGPVQIEKGRSLEVLGYKTQGKGT